MSYLRAVMALQSILAGYCNTLLFCEVPGTSYHCTGQAAKNVWMPDERGRMKEPVQSVHLMEKDWRKSGDIRVDAEDKKAILLINRSPGSGCRSEGSRSEAAASSFGARYLSVSSTVCSTRTSGRVWERA